MDYTLEQVPEVAGTILEGARRRRAPDHATLITLSGDLGAGKTTLVQEMARQLGIIETLQSPTFVIYKKYNLTPGPSPARGGVTTSRVRSNSTEADPLLAGEGGPELVEGPGEDGEDAEWSTLVHGDMYRLESAEDIEKLGWKELLADPKNLILIEWPEQITGAIPEWATCVVIRHLGGEKRHIEI